MLGDLNGWTIVSTVLVLAICIGYFRPRKLAGNEPPLIHPKNGIPFIGHLIGLLRNGFQYYPLVVWVFAVDSGAALTPTVGTILRRPARWISYSSGHMSFRRPASY